MKKSLIATAILSVTGLAGLSSQAMAVPIGQGDIIFANASNTVPAGTFSNTTGSYNGNTGKYASTGGAFNDNFGTNAVTTDNLVADPAEFRMISPGGVAGGGGEKSLVGSRDDGTASDNGLDTITWTTGSGPYTGFVVGSDGDITPGGGTGSLGATQGGLTNAVFFGSFFGFALSSTVPVAVDVNFTSNKISIDVASIEAQWGGQWFPMGDCNVLNQVHPDYVNPNNTTKNLSDGQGCGIHLEGDITNVSGDNFDFTLFGEHRVTLYEDTRAGTSAGAGFAGWNAQFGLSGSFAAVPVPAAVWLFGSGLLGLVGVARRKKVA